MRQVFIFTLLLFLIVSDKKSYAIDEFPNPTKLEIIFNNEIQKLENTFYIAIKISLDEGWKTYWKNPGDSGAPISLSWNLENDKLTDYEILYPTPNRFVDAGIETIGYDS